MFIDNIKFMLMLWFLSIAGYNLQLSSLYKPTMEINFIVLSLCLIFYIASKKVYINDEMVRDFMVNSDSEETYKLYSLIFNIVCIISVITFMINIYYFGLVIFNTDKTKIVDKQEMFHWSKYIVYLLVLCAEVKYILFREKKKILDLIVVTISIGTLMLTLNRGPIAFILVTMAIYELFNLSKNKSIMSKRRIYTTYTVLFLGGVLFLFFFAYMGNLRMNYALKTHFNQTLTGFYGVSSSFPAVLLWPYIYLTSPLENAATALMFQNIDYTYFNNLFYPFIKFFANILGQGNHYKDWLLSRTPYVAHLRFRAGLTVSSFIPQAMQDMGYIGILIYVALYVLLAYFTIWLIRNRKKFSKICVIVIYSNAFSILMWSVFENSLKIPILVLNILIVLFIEFLRKKGVFKFLMSRIKRY